MLVQTEASTLILRLEMRRMLLHLVLMSASYVKVRSLQRFSDT